MSADSPHRSRSQSKVSGEHVTVSPQQVTDPTILDSVAGFINDVVPNAYNVPCDTKDQIQWAHFEQLECDELVYSQNADCDKIIPPPLLLILGYMSGIQVWAVPGSGEATEVLSWRHGSVRVLKVLPTPHRIGACGIDVYASKRPLIALCDNATPGPHYCSLSFISLKTGEQVKVIKFKNPLLEVLANRHSVVVTFAERIAVFDAFTLEDRLTVTTCYLSPGIYANPVALGTRWMAYAENKLISPRRSSGGNEGEGVQSYTATVLHAAKSLGRGLRELGETVASSLTGNVPHKPGISGCHQGGGVQNDILQKGIVTVLDIESADIDTTEKTIENEAVIAHFAAHTEAIVCLRFDPSGLLLLTADKRGHDFHLFRIHPHPGGPSLAAVHHLYVLHRGDTTARVQDMCFSPDSRWLTVSTLRGTTHVFPVTPYGGPVGVRTHASPHVVNRMSRFHRSAGLTAEGRSNSPVTLFEAPINSNLPYHNPRIPPYPHPTVVFPLAQIRQPVYIQNSGNTQQRPHSGRQRLPSSSEDNIQLVLRVRASFAAPRAWIDKLTPPRDSSLSKPIAKPIESLFIMSCHGSLVQYDLEPQHVPSIPKEKVCDDTPIELSVRAKAQWVLQRQPNGKDVQLPLPADFLNYFYQDSPSVKNPKPDHTDDRWLSQVEIVTHAGPHRRLWMGPQFTFKTYSTNSGTSMNIIESKPIDVGRSKPVNMPMTGTYPVLIESGSVSSCEPSPKLLDTYQKNFDEIGGPCELQLREDLADAMLESPGVREAGGRCVIVSMKHHTTGVAKVVNPLGTVVTVQSDDGAEIESVEDAVIHENCDEALFRPVVASKAVLFTEPKNVQSKISHNTFHINRTIPREFKDSIVGKVQSRRWEEGKQDSHSEVDSGIEKERSESPIYRETTYRTPLETKTTKFKLALGKMCSGECRDQPKDCDSPVNDTRKSHKNPVVIKHKVVETKPSCSISDSTGPPPPKTESAIKIKAPAPSDDLDFNLRTLSLKTDDSTDTEKESRTEAKVESSDSVESSSTHNKKDRKLRNDRYQGLEPKDIVSSSEENAVEEKQIPKKSRKPKTKLGVRILTLNKEEVDKKDVINVDKKDEVFAEFTLRAPKKSWSSVAASKPRKEKSPDLLTSPVVPVETRKSPDSPVKSPKSPDLPVTSRKSPDLPIETQIILPEIESMEHFSMELPKMSYWDTVQDNLFNVESRENVDMLCGSGILEPKKVTYEKSFGDDFNFLKVDKSSDEDKLENTSSLTETTESDDSGKVKVESTAMDTEEDSCQPEIIRSSTVGKSGKKKSKKKRK